jgi:hypothetical protein
VIVFIEDDLAFAGGGPPPPNHDFPLSLARGGANQSYIFRRAVFAMQAHLDGRNISGLREAEDFIVPRTTNPRITNAEDLPVRS